MKSVILDFLVDFVFPRFCVVCNKEGAFLCQKCKKKLPAALQICPMCTRPSIYGLTHDYCKNKNGMRGLIAVFDYRNEAVKKIIEAVKFGFNRGLIKTLIVGWKLPARWKGMNFVPVPLHRYRKNWRGFNQAELIAKQVGGQKIIEALKRTRATNQQAKTIDKKARRKNIEGAFEVTEEVKKLRGKKVVLVDDVFTSGATMRECAKVLKKAGIKEVWGFVLAR